ncbi:membrane protein insertase YidC [Streptosporangium sp. KLBMP 9127]|nr:YidC/Oxa1 family membrane protein insertase [Streptosporangium sp. KLBMP 9127]
MGSPSMFDGIITFTSGLLTALADLVAPLAGANATALAIILCTMAVRLALLPLSVLAARGEKTRVRLAPEAAKLRKRFERDPERMRQELSALYAKNNATPLAGCLPSIAQLPFFMLLFKVAGAPSAHTLFGAPLAQQVAGTIGAFGLFSVPVLVFAVVFALLAAVAWVTSRRARAAADDTQPEALRRLLPLLPYGTLLAAAVLPLAAALYLVTTTAWTAIERGVLHPRPATA